MHQENGLRLLSDRLGVVAEPGAVGRAHFLSKQPLAAMTSGTRNPPPISTSCPLETMTSCPARP